MTLGALPPWKVSVVKKTPYIPGLKPEGPPPSKQFTVHLHCILDALSSPPPTSRTPRPKSARQFESVTARLYTPKKQYSPPRPATAPSSRPKTALTMRTPELVRKSFGAPEQGRKRLGTPELSRKSFGTPELSRKSFGTPELGRKSLTPTRMNGDIKNAIKSLPSKPKAGSDKPVAIKPRPRPKAGSDTPVAIRRPPKIPQILKDCDDDDDSGSVDSNENVQAKHGYYIYVDGVKVYTNQPPNMDGKPTASVKPILASDLIINMDSSKETGDLKDFEKDLKPIQICLESTEDSVEASQ